MDLRSLISVILIVGTYRSTRASGSKLEDGDYQTVETVAGEKTVIECNVGFADIEWQRWTRRTTVGLSAAQVDHTGALVFDPIRKEDEGLYRCIATPQSVSESPINVSTSDSEQYNNFTDHVFSSDLIADNNLSQPRDKRYLLPADQRLGRFIYLYVQVPTVLTDYPESQHVKFASQVHLRCAATGDPTPHIDWFLDESQLEDIQSNPFPGYSRSEIRFNVTQTSNFTCRASNTIKGRKYTDLHHLTLHLLEESSDSMDDYDRGVKGEEEEEPRGYCARYTGKICRGYLSNPNSVWFNISNDQTGGWLNEQLTEGLWDEVIKTLKEPCQSAAKKLLCLYAFPECQLINGYAKRLPLCYEDCIATRQLFCANDWALLESNKQRGFYLGSRGHFRLPRCEDLPPIGNYGQGIVGKTPTCSHARLTEYIPADVTTTCVRGRGRFYQGNISVTKDGLPCQRWDSQVPHSHNRPPLNIFPEMQGAENFCRNAGGEEPRPWCYTMDPLVRWQHCNITQCEGDIPSIDSGIEVAVLPMESTFTPGFVLLLAGVSFLSLLIFFLVLLLCQRAFKQKQGYHLSASRKRSMDIDLEKLRDNSAYHYIGAQINPCLEKLEYPRNNIIYIKDLGQGAFGRVFQAKAPNLVKGEAFTIVAVKTLKEEADDEMCADFEKEACLLADLDHPNIIRLLGVCAVEKPMCLLLEYMALGDLKEYLRSCSPSNYIVKTADGQGYVETRLSSIELTSMGRQIAEGMVYLSRRGFVHRDLATRNCLVNENLVVKIADFGLSKQVHWQNYYRGTENDAIPIRWMPLESILYNRYTTASDVWAFGVCLWEIFSFALQPYFGMSHEEVVRFLQGGGVLPPPQYATCAIYGVMRSCWHNTPSERPNFETLRDELTAIEDALCQQQNSTDPAAVHL